MGYLGRIKSNLTENPLFQERVRIKLRLSGWVYIFLTLILGFAAVNSANNVTYLIVSMLLSLMSVSGFFALINLLGVEVYPNTKQEILTKGKYGYLYLSVINNKKLPSFLIDVEIDDLSKRIPFIPPKKNDSFSVGWTPQKRGVFKFSILRIGSSFPFGFIWRGVIKKTNIEIIVAPSPVDFPFPVNDGVKGSYGKSLGQGYGDWIGIRNYKKGEPIGSIIWKKVDWNFREYQRVYNPLPSHHLASDDLIMKFDIDDPSIQNFDMEKRLSVLRSWIDYANRNNLQWELRLGSIRLVGNGKNFYEKCLKILAMYGNEESKGNI